jgi:F-type H+-transporting ATPase subunit b
VTIMQIRKMLAGAALVGLALVLASTAAYPGETEEPETPEEEVEEEVHDEVEAEEGEISHIGHCIEEAHAAGTDPEECVEAPNPILPEVNEIIWGGGAFLVLLVLMWWKLLPPIKQGLADRQERIREDLAKAEQARTEGEEVLAQYQAQVANAKAEANRIIEDARQTADSLRADLQARAEADIAEMRRRAAADIEAAKAQAVADLTAEVATLAIGAAEVVVQKSLDRETQVQLVENYIQQVGAGR